MLTRALIVVALLMAAAAYASRSSSAEALVARDALADLPMTIEDWRGQTAAPFHDDILAKLGVDDYINRYYERSGMPPVAVYVGYYATQRQGDTIHSPQNCLPGAGWTPIEAGRQQLHVGGRAVSVNRYIITKGLDRQVVLYWYQGRNRVVASEYANKAYLMLDAARLRRTNGGLVRLMMAAPGEASVDLDGLNAFATALVPRLARHLP
jgi:EpsI family protein